MKRLFANRPDWKRILRKRFYRSFIDTTEYAGWITLLCMDEVQEPLWTTKTRENPICIVDAGYSWLQHFPQGKRYSVTTMFNEEGKIVQWYIDMCLQHGVTENNIPYLDDLFLDIVVSPNGEIKLMDVHELENALRSGEISRHEYELALSESNYLMEKISRGNFILFDLCELHRQALLPAEID